MLVFGVDVPLLEMILIFSVIIVVILLEIIIVMILAVRQLGKSKQTNEGVKKLAEVILQLKEEEAERFQHKRSK